MPEPLTQFPATSSTPPAGDLSRVLQRQLPVAVHLARRRMTLGQVARLNVGETIELGKRCDEPLDLVVNGQIIGHGRAVTVGGKIGLRLTAVADIRQIIRALGK